MSLNNTSSGNLAYIERLEKQLESRAMGIVIVESAFVILINSTTFFGNLLVVTAVFRNPRLRQSIPNVYIIALSVADLLMSVLGIAYSSASTVAGRWPLGSFFCQFQGFVVLLLCAASLQTLALTAVNRYFRTTRSNVEYRKYFTMKSTKVTVAVLCLSSFLAPVPYVAMGEDFIFHPGKVFCTHNITTLVGGYGAVLVIVYVAIPFSVIIFCYTKVFICVRQHNKTSFRVHTAGNEGTAPRLRLSVEEINITWTLLVVVLGFLLCWTPVLVIDLIDFKNGDWELSRQAYLSYSCFGYSSTAINPFIYGVMNRHFRQEYAKILPFLKAFASRATAPNTNAAKKNNLSKNTHRNVQSTSKEKCADNCGATREIAHGSD